MPASASANAPAPAPGDPLRRPVVYRISGMDEVEVQRDLVYRRGEGVDLTMDVYVPPDLPEGERLAGVVFVHGGPVPLSAQPKNWGVFVSYGELMAASGLVGVTLNHRYEDTADLGQSADDIATAIHFIRENAASFHLDPGRLCVWVFSGGGLHVSALLRDQPAFLRCIVAYYAVLDSPANPEFSPMTYLNKNVEVPLFIARAGLDQQVNETIDRFVESARSVGVAIEMADHRTGQHGFDILDDDDPSRQIIARTLAFIKANLGE